MAKSDVKSNITKFLSGENIILNSEEEKILARWEFANDQLTAKKHEWKEIRDKIALKFAVSRFTAENDIVNAQEVYGLNRKINKKFLMHLHIERLDQVFEMYKTQLFRVEKDEDGKDIHHYPGHKEAAALAKLGEAYTYAVNSAPQDVDNSRMPPPILVYHLPDGVELPIPDIKDLLKAADDYLDFEIVKDGPKDS